nr:WD40 repeat domain-containing protein [Streptomyces marokkonensis]
MKLWDARTHRRLATLTGHTATVGSVVVSWDGKTLVTISEDRTIRLWDLETHQQVALYTGHTGVVNSAVFSPDGNTLVTSASDQTVRLWDARVFRDLAALTDQVCAIAGRSLTEREWHRYVPDGVPYRRICP